MRNLVSLAGLALLLSTCAANAQSGRFLEPAGSADDFVDRIGFCTHWGYSDTPYGFAYDRIKAMLGDIGVRHVRDGWLEREADLYSALGVKTTMIFGPGSPPEQTIQTLKAHLPLVDMVEGPNEVDIFATSANYKGKGFPEGPRLFTQETYAALKADPATRGFGFIAPSVGRADGNRALAPLSSFDYLVMHSYAGGQMPSQSLMADMNNPVLTAYGLLGAGTDAKPFVVTESGYHTALGSSVVIAGAQPGVSERAQEKYLPRHFAAYYNFGIRRTFTYEFVDEFPDYATDEHTATNAEACFGIVKRDLAPKPAYGAIKRLIAALSEKRWDTVSGKWVARDPAPAANVPYALAFHIEGETAAIRHTLLQKTNGDFYLLLWQEVSSFDTVKAKDIDNAPAHVMLTVNTPLRSAGLITGAMAGGAAAQKLLLSIPDEIVVVRLSPQPLVSGHAPSAPVRLSSQAHAASATLTWAPGPGPKPAGYAIYRLGALVGTGTTPSFTDTTLLPGLGYGFEVRAIDTAGRVSPAASLHVSTPNAYPDLTVTAVTISPTHPNAGDEVTFTATLKNIGQEATAQGVTLGIAFHVDGVIVNWADRLKGPLRAGEEQVITANNGPKGKASWTLTPGPHKLRAIADDVNRVVERSKENNTLEINLP